MAEMVTDAEAAEWHVKFRHVPGEIAGRLLADRDVLLALAERTSRFMHGGDIALRLNRESDVEELIQLRADAWRLVKEAGRGD